MKAFSSSSIALVVVGIVAGCHSAWAQTADCPSDIISYWKLDEAAGTTFADSAGANDANCAEACSTPVPIGKVGGAQSFDSIGLTAVDAPGADFNWASDASFSIEFWMRKNSGCSGDGPEYNEVILGRLGGTVQWSAAVVCDSAVGQGRLSFSLKAADGDEATVTTGLEHDPDVTDGQWYHVTIVRDGSAGTHTIYVNGSEEGSVAHAYTTPTGFDAGTAPVNIGWLNAATGYHYTGDLDEVAIYNRALTPTEIKSHYYLSRGYCDPCASVRIMPVGDSITLGRPSGVEPNEPNYWISYRERLWDNLIAGGYSVDFVGSQMAGMAYAGEGFDPDHEGHGGWKDEEVAAEIYNWLVANPADVVLLHIGTNGLDRDPNDVKDILDQIDRYEIDYQTDVTVVLARIINQRGFVCPGTSKTTDFNDNVEAMAALRIAAGDKIIPVNLECGAGLDYRTQPAGDMWDLLHPYRTGYEKMADKWFEALQTFLSTCSEVVIDPPSITAQPLDQSVVAGEDATFSVSATGTGPLSYQWQSYNGASWEDIPDANAADHTISPTSASDDGTMVHCVVSNAAGSETSQSATLTVTVIDPPTIVTHPSDQTVLAGDDATFSVTATGTAPLSYQWQSYNGVAWEDIVDANAADYTISPTSASDDGTMLHCVVSNAAGSETSQSATLTVTVIDPPTIITEPNDQTVLAGDDASFSVTATGTAPLAYQWQFLNVGVWEDLPEENAPSLTIPQTDLSDDETEFRCVVSNTAGSVTSQSATLTVVEGFSLTVTYYVPDRGTVDVDPNQPTYYPGAVVSLTPQPEPGYIFAYWDGIDVPEANATDWPLLLTMDAPKTVVAVFIPEGGIQLCGAQVAPAMLSCLLVLSIASLRFSLRRRL